MTAVPSDIAMNNPDARWPRARWIPLACAAAVTLLTLAASLPGGLVDDSYIFLRYAHNIAEGHGPVFNIGERVEGFSSPLWTFLLGGLGAIFADLERVAVAAGLACGIGAVVILLRATLRDARPVPLADAVVLALGLASGPSLVLWSVSGMDAPLFVLLVSASLVSILNDLRLPALSARTATLLFLATLARPEGVLLAAYAGLFFLFRRQRVRVLSGYGLAIGAMVLARYFYYDAWLPNTYHAKVTFPLLHRLTEGAAYLGSAARSNAALLLVLVVAIGVAARARAFRWKPGVFLAGWVVLWAAYVVNVGGDNFAFHRFLLPTLPALFLMLAFAWSDLHRLLGDRPGVRLACMAALIAAFGVSHVASYSAEAKSHYGSVRLARQWANVGRWLARSTPPDTVIATIVPGATAYFSGRRTIDMLGLTDRTVARDGLVYAQAAHGHARYHTDYIFDQDPDIVLYHTSGRFDHPVYDDPEQIHRAWGYALYDLVTDPRCVRRYTYATAPLGDGTIAEMQIKRGEGDRLLARASPAPVR